MIVDRYYIIYVRVPHGYPGVDIVLAENKQEAIDMWKIANKHKAIINVKRGH